MMEQLTNFVSKSFEYNNNKIKEDEASSIDGDKLDEIDITEVGRDSPVPLVKRNRSSAVGAPAKNWLLPDSERRTRSPQEPRRYFGNFIKTDIDTERKDYESECGVINYSKDREESSCSDDETKNVNVEDDDEWSRDGVVVKDLNDKQDEDQGSQENQKPNDGDTKSGIIFMVL